MKKTIFVAQFYCYVKQITKTISLQEYDTIEELTPEQQALLTAAELATHRAYAPYSNFYVGAAVLLENNEIIIGTNQENAAYPSGLCAERTAIFAAATCFPNVAFTKIAIVANAKNWKIDTPVYPCGACRQSLSEYEFLHKKNIEVIMKGKYGKIHIANSISDLLPFMFTSDNLTPY